MPDSLLIRGGRIIDPSQDIDKTANLLIKDGKILWLGDGAPLEQDALEVATTHLAKWDATFQQYVAILTPTIHPGQ